MASPWTFIRAPSRGQFGGAHLERHREIEHARTMFDVDRDSARIDAVAAALDRAVDPAARPQIARYAELAAAWSLRTDLVAAKDPQSLLEVLLVDALVLADTDIVPTGVGVVDIGAGVGAPGLTLALLRDDLDVTLVEPRRRRVVFLRTVIGTLGLVDRVRVVERRFEPESRPPGSGRSQPGSDLGEFDVAVSRATFAPADWLRAGRSLAPVVLVLTATADPPPAPEGCSYERSLSYCVPTTQAKRAVSRYRWPR